MQSKLTEVTFDIDLQPGEVLSLPEGMQEIVGPGHWVVSIKPSDGGAVRDHSAFLNSYGPKDEGLYDDYSAG
jgi:hypothetical protein